MSKAQIHTQHPRRWFDEPDGGQHLLDQDGGLTATQGYEQLESFLNFPNKIFQILSVSTDYTADTSTTVSDPNDKAYGDACTWENNPTPELPLLLEHW